MSDLAYLFIFGPAVVFVLFCGWYFLWLLHGRDNVSGIHTQSLQCFGCNTGLHTWIGTHCQVLYNSNHGSIIPDFAEKSVYRDS